MESALVVSCSAQGTALLTELLHTARCENITAVRSCGEARRLLMERSYDVCLVNAPLTDETGENLARHIAQKEAGQVILLVKNEFYESVSQQVEDYGVLVVGKPIQKSVLWSALKLAGAAQKRMCAMRAENSRLTQKIEDIRVVDRAKCVLISYLNMTEPEAHKYIEKQAMDLRVTKRDVAQDLLRTYENP